MSTTSHELPSPQLFFETVNAFQKTAAIKAAIDLNFFSAMAEGSATAAELARHCQAAERGVRILADYLTILGFLTKEEGRYALTQDSAIFLNRKSPAYAGDMVQFLLNPELRHGYDDIAGTIRAGGTSRAKPGTVTPENPIWLEFARAMAPLMKMPAQILAERVKLEGAPKMLDISASHGTWGMAFAEKYPEAELVAVDWAPVLELTRAKAKAAGLAERFRTIAGDAFEVEFGSGYDLVLVPNFLHHFTKEKNVEFLQKAHAALREGGQVAIVEFVPNEDRISPPEAASFSFVMLASTPEGDAYTLSEIEEMLTRAGFELTESFALPPMSTGIVGRKK
jgi:predicted O-methyltransferase YrrM